MAVAAEALLDLVDLVLRVEAEGCDDVSGANGARHSFDSSARSTNALAFCLPPLVFVIINCFVSAGDPFSAAAVCSYSELDRASANRPDF